MRLARCRTCGEAQPVADDATGYRWLIDHDATHRDVEVIRQLPTVDWHGLALQAVRELAASGKPFVISEVIRLGVPDAPSPRTDWANIQREAEALGWIKATGRLGRSIRPTTKRSPCTE